ncbi:MAG: lipoate--protein ligase family protein [Candidatus Omnitrophica bacterium]|nr:lipoate--protein ligase family protein [Candidatus Omnitrophota bacterium]
MYILNLTGHLPEENLAYDEALLNLCEEGLGGETLRFWEAASYFVVLGYSNKINSEVQIEDSRRLKIPLLRRPSGGGTVLQGPGCLNYSLILKISDRPQLQHLQQTNEYILNRHCASLQPLLPGHPLSVQGISDLTTGSLKFSGNAQRRKKEFVLFHGTFLTHFDLSLIGKVLRMPPKKPDYRGERSHLDFVTNIPLSCETIRHVLSTTWQAETKPADEFMNRLNNETTKLVKEKYQKDEWNLKF